MATFGAQLKQERERQGVTLEEISLSTKIGTRMLRALEEEHFDQLPGGIFNKGFIRAYARCLGMDEDQAVADYLAATGATPLAKKFEIAFARHSGRTQVVLNYENRDAGVLWNHNRPDDASLCEDHVIAFHANAAEPVCLKDSFEGLV